jgi:cephalosporin hydroxylase
MDTPAELDTDKIGHGYGPAYQEIAATLGGFDPYTAVEIGIGGGQGARWLRQLLDQYGQVVTLIGVDIDPSRTNPVGPTVTADVRAYDFPERIAGELAGQPPLTLVVDDGAHTPATILPAFHALWPLLAPGGFYVVEDWNHAGFIGLEAIQELACWVGPGAGPAKSEAGIARLTLYPQGLAIAYKAPALVK